VHRRTKKKKSCYIKVVRDYVRACDVYFRIFKIVNDESRGCCCNFSVNVLMNRFKRKGNGRLYVVTATCGCVLMFGKVNLYSKDKLIKVCLLVSTRHIRCSTFTQHALACS
jgi:hypothetical protein